MSSLHVETKENIQPGRGHLSDPIPSSLANGYNHTKHVIQLQHKNPTDATPRTPANTAMEPRQNGHG